MGDGDTELKHAIARLVELRNMRKSIEEEEEGLKKIVKNYMTKNKLERMNGYDNTVAILEAKYRKTLDKEAIMDHFGITEEYMDSYYSSKKFYALTCKDE